MISPTRARPALTLVATGMGALVIAYDLTAVNIALPAIEGDLDVDVGTAQWVVSAYALTFGMVIITGGRLADMFGRRRVFAIGAAIFSLFSLLGAVSPNAGFLIAMRVGMGVGVSLMLPAILGLTYAALPAAEAGLAGGLILGAAGVGNAIGPLVGGTLSDQLSWRWIFILNVPLALASAGVAWLRVPPEQHRVASRRIDYAGIGSLSIGLLLVLLALDQARDWGWSDPRVVTLLVGAVIAIVAFGRIEHRLRDDALIPTTVSRDARFTAACLTALLLAAVLFTSVLYAPQLMEKALGYSALRAGIGMLPMLGISAAASFAAGPLYERFGGRVMVLAGAAGLAAGPLLLSLFDAGSGYASLVPGLIVTGVGIGLFYPSIVTAAETALDSTHASLAGGILYMSEHVGGALALGVITAVVTASSSFVTGVEAGFRVVAAIALTGAVLAAVTLRPPATPAS